MKNLTPFDRWVRLVAVVIFGWLAFAVFSHPIARILFVLVAIGALYEAVSATCPLFASLGVKKVGQRMSEAALFLLGLLGLQLTLAYIWWNAGWEKVNGTFVADIHDTLEYFASEVPHDVYFAFLNNYVLPNAALIGTLVMWSQLVIGFLLFVSVLMILSDERSIQMGGYALSVIALLAGAFQNANFWLAAGWTGPATATANIAMFWPSLLLLYVWCARCREMRK